MTTQLPSSFIPDTQSVGTKMPSSFVPDSQEESKPLSLSSTPGEIMKSYAQGPRRLFNMLTSSEQGLGATAGQSAAVNSNDFAEAQKSSDELAGMQGNVMSIIREKKARGEDTSRLETALAKSGAGGMDVNEIAPASQKTNMQALGEIGGTTLDLLTAGTYGAEKTAGMQSFKLAANEAKALPTVVTATKDLIKNPKKLLSLNTLGKVGVGAGIGYGYDVTQGMQNGEDNPYKPGLGTTIGAGIPILGELAGKTGKAVSQAAQVDNLEGKYDEWAGLTKPGVKMINKAEQKTAMLDNAGTTGRTPQRVLAEQGIIPETKGTKFSTFDQANDLRDKTMQLRDLNRQALAEVEQQTPKINLADQEEKAVALARSPRNIANNTADALEKDIRNEYATYRKNYGNEVSLTTLDDIKSGKWGKTKFDMMRPLQGDVNYIIGKTAQQTIVETAQKAGLNDVAQLNREIGDRLEAAQFLQKLDGNTIKGGRLTKLAFMGIGAGLGHSLPSKIVGALGGEFVAEILMKAEVGNPVRRMILKNLEQKNPQAYQDVVKWIGEQDAARSTRLQLPPPNPANSTINQGRAIPMMPKGRNVDYIGPEQTVGQSTSRPSNLSMTSAMNTAKIDSAIPESISQAVPTEIQKSLDSGDILIRGKSGRTSANPLGLEGGVWATNNPDLAKDFGDKFEILPMPKKVFESDPFELAKTVGKDDFSEMTASDWSKVRKNLIKEGYDAVNLGEGHMDGAKDYWILDENYPREDMETYNKSGTGTKIEPYTSPSELPSIPMGPKAKSKYTKPNPDLPTIQGKIGLSALLGGTVATGGATTALTSKKEELYSSPQPEPQKNKVDVDKLAQQIKYNESRGEKNPYAFSRDSGQKSLGKALGAYQVTEGELKTYAPKFLGRSVTPAEFLSRPDLQDAYMAVKISSLASRGLTPEEIMAVHNKGMSDLTPEGRAGAVKKSGSYVTQGSKQYYNSRSMKELTSGK